MVFDLLNTALGSLSLGFLFALAFLFPERDGVIESSALRLTRLLKAVTGGWLLFSILNLLSTLADLFESSILKVLDYNTIRSYVTQTSLGRSQMLEVFGALLLAILIFRVRKTGGAFLAFLIATLAVIAPLFQSHSSQAGSHGLAVGSLVIHVIALSIWFGSVASLLLMDVSTRELALPRVSIIATWAMASVILTGVVSALIRLGFTSDWLTIYGLMIAAKVALLAGILIFAQRIRGDNQNINAVRFEVSLFLIVLSIGSLLSRFTPIVDSELPYDRVRDLVGISMPSAPTLSRLFFEYEADGLILGALIFATALYIRGVVVLSRRGDKWPIGRTISFAIGISLIDYATSGGLGLYSIFSFQYHMAAHMVISMIAPIAIVLSAPITLALRTLPIGRTADERGIRKWALSILHSRISSIWTHPVVALAIFDGSLFALYFTPLFGDLMRSHTGHLFMNLHFIAAGALFFYVIIGIDPNPRRVHHLVRMVILLAAMSIHAFFSVALMSSTNLIDGGYYLALERPWSSDLLADQRLGAAIGWAMGEIPIVFALAAVFIQWMRSDRREASRADKDERALDEYNEYLKRLAQPKRES